VQSTRARPDERTCALPGDALIGDAIVSITHGITINAPPARIWPWLVQMGAGRAGWYSYDRIDNGGVRSLERLAPELQHIELGGLMPWLPGATEGFQILDFQNERYLTLGWAPKSGDPVRMTWTFFLNAIENETTRLVVRARAAKGYRFQGLPPRFSILPALFAHTIMQRKQLLGIAARAQRANAEQPEVNRTDLEWKGVRNGVSSR
jgi:hypothetical protein